MCVGEERKKCRLKTANRMVKRNEGERKATKTRGSFVRGLRMSCNLMSLDESWLSELTQFFALLVTVLSVMMFAPDYWCHSQCGIAFFWSYVFLCATTLFLACMCRMLNLAPASHRMTSFTLCSRHPFKTCLQCLNRRRASILPCINTECGWPCAHLYVYTVFTQNR